MDTSQLCKGLTNIGYFGREDVFHPSAWIKNFQGADVPLAECILQNLIYISQSQIRSLVGDALSSLSRVLISDADGSLSHRWDAVKGQILLVGVSDPDGAGGESGPVFTRIAKLSHGFKPENIRTPAEAVSCVKDATQKVVFIDDTVGSGSQFKNFWYHRWNDSDSFHSAAAHWKSQGEDYAQPEFFYIPLVAYSKGLNYISQQCEGVKVMPVYRLDDEYSAKNPNSLIWNDRFPQHAIDSFVIRNSRVAGIHNDIWGHDNLGLCVVLETGVPDFTLPLLTHSSNTWNPLIKQL